MTYVVVKFRAYAVTIGAAEIPRSTCVEIALYEDTAACRTKWGGIIIKRTIEVFPG